MEHSAIDINASILIVVNNDFLSLLKPCKALSISVLFFDNIAILAVDFAFINFKFSIVLASNLSLYILMIYEDDC